MVELQTTLPYITRNIRGQKFALTPGGAISNICKCDNGNSMLCLYSIHVLIGVNIGEKNHRFFSDLGLAGIRLLWLLTPTKQQTDG
jgi:hypothetical protein